MLYCETGEFAAVCSGKAQMKQIDTEILTLAVELEPEIRAITAQGEITLIVQNGWVSAVGSFVKKFRRKRKTVD